MTDIEELKVRVQELELQLSHALMAADAEARFADEFRAKYEAEKIERQFFQHGHRIASDNCVRLEGLLEEARNKAEVAFSNGWLNRADLDAARPQDGMRDEAMKQLANEVARLNRDLEEARRDADRFQWIEENCRTEGGGHGFTVFVPVDHEDIGCGIDAARQQSS